LSEFQSPSRGIFIGSHSLPPLWSPNRSFRGAFWPRVLSVRRVFLSVFFSICWPAISGRKEFGGPSAQRPRTVRAARVALGQSACRVRTVQVLGCTAGGPVAFNRPSAQGSRTVHPVLADHPPLLRGLSARAFVGQLSHLLLESYFRFGIIWGLFLGLVGLV
jgi:hypothetical protein